MCKPTHKNCIFKHTLTFSLLRGLKGGKKENKLTLQVTYYKNKQLSSDMESCSPPPIRLASDESRSPPVVLVGGGVAGGAAATPPTPTGVPMLPAVLPAVLPPVLWGVTEGISRSPKPSSTWSGWEWRSDIRYTTTCRSLISL